MLGPGPGLGLGLGLGLGFLALTLTLPLKPNQASSGAMLIACFSSGLVVGAPLEAFRGEERPAL